jgi:serine/threonine protein kinase
MVNRMNKKNGFRRIIKLVCVITILCFMTGQLAWAYPVSDINFQGEKLAVKTMATDENSGESFGKFGLAYLRSELQSRFAEHTIFDIGDKTETILNYLTDAASHLHPADYKDELNAPKPRVEKSHGQIKVFIGEDICIRLYFPNLKYRSNAVDSEMVLLEEGVISEELHVNYQTYARGGAIKKPRNKKGLAEKEFERNLNNIRKNDESSKYLSEIREYLNEFVGSIKNDKAYTDLRKKKLSTLKGQLTRQLLKIYTFRAIVKNPEGDHFMGKHDLKTKELFLAIDILRRIDALDKTNEEKKAIRKKYLLHELICPIFGHDPSRKILDKYYGEEDDLTQVLRAVKNRESSHAKSEKSINFHDYGLTIPQQKETGLILLNEKTIRQRMEENWFYNVKRADKKTGKVKIHPKTETIKEIKKIRSGLEDILANTEVYDSLEERAMRVFVSGSNLWCDKYVGDVEIDIVVDGTYPLQSEEVEKAIVKKVLAIANLRDNPASIKVNVFGTKELEQAVKSKSSKNKDLLRAKIITLSHEAVQIAGEELDLRVKYREGDVSRDHYDNIRSYVDSLQYATGEIIAAKTRSKKSKLLLDWMNSRVKIATRYEQDRRGSDKSITPSVSLEGLSFVPKITESVAATMPYGRVDYAAAQAPAALKIKLPTPTPRNGSKSALLNGKYKLIEQLGEGGQGAVWSAIRVENGQEVGSEVAIKTMLLDPNSSDERQLAALKRFNKEIEALDKLKGDKNFMQIYDWYDETDEIPYYAMEILNGVTLTEYFSQKNLKESDVARMFAEIAAALKRMHAEGLVHRDLKPDNILVHDGVPIILDFGLVKKTKAAEHSTWTQLTMDEKIHGTPLYMAPEMVHILLDPKSRIHGLIPGAKPAFSADGATGTWDDHSIRVEIDAAEKSHEEYTSKALWRKVVDLSIFKPQSKKISRLGWFDRFVRLRIAMKRVKPILKDLHERGLIEEQPRIHDVKVIESESINFGAAVKYGTLYIERPFLEDRPLERILIGDTHQEFKEDIYSLGVILYQVLTGELPYEKRNYNNDLTAFLITRLKGTVPIEDQEEGKKISADFAHIINSALTVDSRDRYRASDFEAELNRISEKEPSQDYQDFQKTAKLWRTYKLLYFGAIGSITAYVASLIFNADFPSHLVPSIENIQLLTVFTGITEWGVPGIQSGIILFGAIAILFGAIIILRESVRRYWDTQTYLHERASLLEIPEATLIGKVESVKSRMSKIVNWKPSFSKKKSTLKIKKTKMYSIAGPLMATSMFEGLTTSDFISIIEKVGVFAVSVILVVWFFDELKKLKKTTAKSDNTKSKPKEDLRENDKVDHKNTESSAESTGSIEEEKLHPVLENMKWVLPELVYAMQGAAYSAEEEKFVIAIDEDLGASEAELKELMSLIEEVKKANSKLFKNLKNIELVKGRGIDLADRLSRLKNVKKENIVIITTMGNLETETLVDGREKKMFADFENTSHVTGIFHLYKSDKYKLYLPLAETVMFTLARANNVPQEVIKEMYKHIPNAEELNDSEILKKVWNEKTESYETKVVIDIIPGADAVRKDDKLIEDLRKYIASNA